MLVYRILKGDDEISICNGKDEFLQKANDLHSIYCQVNKIVKADLKKVRDAELCLYSIGYIVTNTIEPDQENEEIKEQPQEFKDIVDEAIEEKPPLVKPINQHMQNINTIAEIITDKLIEEVEIQKISLNKEAAALYIEYENYVPNKNSKKIIFKGYEPCTVEILKEFQGLNLNVCEILDFPEDWAEKITVNGISLSWKDSDLFGAVLICQLRVVHVNCPLNINTPFLRFENDHEKTLPYELLLAIKKIIEEAKAYMGGKVRVKQMGLFDNNKD